ncbi:MAG: response regulator transcription factor [Melioribacteraceae bacterium]|nr:response regulator transcription factor [Melioribacteraceae bacterium]
MEKIKVILADDHRMVRSSFAKVLSEEEVIQIVAEVSNGFELIEYIKDNPVDVIILDYNMPEMDGIETISKLRELNYKKAIIMLTMHSDENVIIGALEEGINGFLFKDSEIEELIAAIKIVDAGGEYFCEEVKNKLIKYHSGKMHRRYHPLNPQKIPVSKREIEIIRLIADGFKSYEIAGKLFISESTVVKHRKNIIRKLDLKNTTEVVKYAAERGLL